MRGLILIGTMIAVLFLLCYLCKRVFTSVLFLLINTEFTISSALLIHSGYIRLSAVYVTIFIMLLVVGDIAATAMLERNLKIYKKKKELYKNEA